MDAEKPDLGLLPRESIIRVGWRKLNLNDQLASVRDNVHQLLTGRDHAAHGEHLKTDDLPRRRRANL